MKKYFLFLLILSFSSVELLADDQFYISQPTNGQTFYIPSGQSTINIQVCWVFESDTLDYGAWKLITDVGTFSNVTSCYTMQNVPFGSKSWTLRGTSPSGATISTSVNFNVVLTTAVIIADNNFTDNSGNGTHGTMTISGTNRTIPSTGYEFTKNVGDNLSLLAVSPQTDNQGYQRIWHTGSYEPSSWTINDVYQSSSQTYSHTVVSSDHDATFMANLNQITATTSGVLSSNENWFTEVTLTGDVYVPNGVTLTITTDATVSLGSYSIISTGGEINNQGTVNTIKAYLYSSSTIKGLCPSIKAATANCSSGQRVEMISGSINENFSFNGKDNITIHGSSTTIGGYIDVYDSDNIVMNGFNVNGRSIVVENSSFGKYLRN